MSKALLLPGGGARGVIQAGMLSAWLKNNSYDALYGTSVGALNGFLIHQGDVKQMLNMWQTIKNSDIYTWNPLKAFGKAGSLASSAPLERLIINYVDIDKLEANHKPFYVTASQISPIKAVSRQMPCEDSCKWLLCSASAPIAFPVQTYLGRQYTDGGPTRDYNIELAISHGHTDITVLCPTNNYFGGINNLIDMLEFQMSVQAATQYNDESQLATILNKSKHVVSLTVYRPDGQLDLGLLDFNNAGKNYEKWFNLGYNLLNKPAIQFRRTLQAGQLKWNIYK